MGSSKLYQVSDINVKIIDNKRLEIESPDQLCNIPITDSLSYYWDYCDAWKDHHEAYDIFSVREIIEDIMRKHHFNHFQVYLIPGDGKKLYNRIMDPLGKTKINESEKK